MTRAQRQLSGGIRQRVSLAREPVRLGDLVVLLTSRPGCVAEECLADKVPVGVVAERARRPAAANA